MAFTNITGGEPFLRKDIHEIVRELYKKSDRVVISTNGYFTDRIIALCKRMKKLLWVILENRTGMNCETPNKPIHQRKPAMNFNHLPKLKTINFRQSPVIVQGITAFFSTWAVMRIGSFHSMDIIGLALYLLLFSFFQSVEKKNSASGYPSAYILLTNFFSLLFTLMYVAGSYRKITSDVTNGLFKLLLIFVTFLGLYFLFRKILFFLTKAIFEFSLKKENNFSKTNNTESSQRFRDRIFMTKLRRYLPVICFLLCLLNRIPYFLYSYPGIMTPDSINQMEQVLRLKPFSNHHPWIHTLTISLLYRFGTLFTENQNFAFTFYTIFQIIFMAAAASYLIYILSKYLRSTALLVCIILFYAFMPYHNVMAICIWKDVLFSGSVLLFCTSFFDLLKIRSLTESKLSLLIYFFSGILFCLYRSNGWYAFLLSLPFLLIAFWKKKKVMFPLHFLILFIVLIIKGPVMEHYGVTQPDFVESLSIPLQQIGRVVATGQSLTKEEYDLLNKIMAPEHIPNLYREYISDPMKELVRANDPDYLSSHKAEYLILWIRLGLKYPGIYLDAYIEQTKGFYSPSTVYSVMEVDGIIENNCGITREYFLRGKVIVKLREILIKLHEMIPVYGAFWSMGSLFWMTLLSCYFTLSYRIQCVNSVVSNPLQNNQIYRFPKNLNQDISEFESKVSIFRLISLWMPGIAVILTLLIATPVAIEFRYAYHLAYCLPLYIGIFFSEWSNLTHE